MQNERKVASVNAFFPAHRILPTSAYSYDI